jgi:hypothetical protein
MPEWMFCFLDIARKHMKKAAPLVKVLPLSWEPMYHYIHAGKKEETGWGGDRFDGGRPFPPCDGCIIYRLAKMKLKRKKFFYSPSVLLFRRCFLTPGTC